MRGARARLLTSALAISLASVSASACHCALASAPHTQPAPAVRAVAAAAPTLTDRQWIDSVAQSWAAQQAISMESNATRRATVQRARQPAPALASTEPTTSATSYAEAAVSGGPAPIVDDRGPLIVICAIGATALIVAVTAARVANGR